MRVLLIDHQLRIKFSNLQHVQPIIHTVVSDLSLVWKGLTIIDPERLEDHFFSLECIFRQFVLLFAAWQPASQNGAVNAMVRIDCIAKDTIAALRLALISAYDSEITSIQFAAIVQGLLDCAFFAPLMPGFSNLESEDFRLHDVAVWLVSFQEQSLRGWSMQDVESVLLAVKAEDDALTASYESD